MARRKQSSSGFNVSGFDGVEMSVDLGQAIDVWREQFLNTVGMNDKNRGLAKYRRAAGWAVDEVAKDATTRIRQQFSRHLKKNTSWTKSAIAYKRLSKADLNGLERGERRVEDLYAQVYVKPGQSAYLKYLFGMDPNVRLPGDVGLASRHILIPWWDNITLTQGGRPTADGNVPRSFLARLARQAEGKVAHRGRARPAPGSQRTEMIPK